MSNLATRKSRRRVAPHFVAFLWCLKSVVSHGRLQAVIALLKKADLDVALQFVNYR